MTIWTRRALLAGIGASAVLPNAARSAPVPGSEIKLSDVDGIRQNLAAIRAGSFVGDLTGPINTALQHHARVIVPRGVYPIGATVLLSQSGQRLEFEDEAWFLAMNPAMNGIAVPHGRLDCAIVNPGLIGNSTAQKDCADGMHTAILWNSDARGILPFGSPRSDDMGGLVEFGRFKGRTEKHGWHTAIHSNMAGGYTARNCNIRGLIGTASGHGYGHVFSGRNVTSKGHDIDAVIAGNGRHGIYLGDQCAGANVANVRIRNMRKSALCANTNVTGSNIGVTISDLILEDVCLDADTSFVNAAIELNYQGRAQNGGSGFSISNVTINRAGASGIYMRGYRNVRLENVSANDWGLAGGGHVAGLNVQQCQDVDVRGFVSRTSVSDSAKWIVSHVFVRQTDRLSLTGGSATNSGNGSQRSAVNLDLTPPGVRDVVIEGFAAMPGRGRWSAGAYVNYRPDHLR